MIGENIREQSIALDVENYLLKEKSGKISMK